MGQVGTLPRRKHGTYVMELHEWYSTFTSQDLDSCEVLIHEMIILMSNPGLKPCSWHIQQKMFMACNCSASKGTLGSPFDSLSSFGSSTRGCLAAATASRSSASDGIVDFREYVTAISMLIQGTPEEKLRWSFKLYDKDKDGSITRSEMLEIMQAVYKMSLAASLTKVDPLTAEECTNRIFVRLDKDKDAVINLQEFTEGALDDEWIRKMLECDPNTVEVERPQKIHTSL
nr:PREDICTED: guanylyl cyclase inhibitory protein-like [Latimeria chalumnae]|eukprot:XP_014348670.1 PREDICTED: guanylyl cyclase inhibitory protein-like [Latimeria chalumnae]